MYCVVKCVVYCAQIQYNQHYNTAVGNAAIISTEQNGVQVGLVDNFGTTQFCRQSTVQLGHFRYGTVQF